MFKKSGKNYVDGQICHLFYHRLAELLPKMWQFYYLGRLATVIGSFVTRFGRFAGGWGWAEEFLMLANRGDMQFWNF